MYSIPKLWLGDDNSTESFALALQQYAKLEAQGGFKAYGGSEREQLGLDPLLSVQDGVGVIHISGNLVAGNAGFMALFGATGYEDIRGALAEALLSPEVNSVMLHISSGGGVVTGCEDLAAFMTSFKAYKPLTTYADGLMCSAAYWLGSHGEHISTNQTTTLGSLGVVMVHLDRSKMLAQDGVTPTVVRSGKYKMLANAVEPLSADALAGLQSQCDTIYDVFIQAVADNRKVTYKVADTQMGQGREFLGKAAVESGLADHLMSYDEALAYAKGLNPAKPMRNNMRNQNGAMNMKVTLNTAQLAALAAGANLSMLGVDEASEITNLPAPVVKADISVADLTGLTEQLALAKASAASLQGEITAANLSATAAQAALGLSQANATQLSAKAATLEAQVAAMLPVLQGAVASMSTALGGTVATEALDPTQALAKYSELAEPFAKRFPGGRISTLVGLKGAELEDASKPSMAYLNLIRSGKNAQK